MKKSIILRIFTALIIIVIILIIVTIFGYRSASMPSYHFCSGRGKLVKMHAYSDPLFRQTIYCCSFEADFNDICADAVSELKELGYVGYTSSLAADTRGYKLPGKNSIDVTAVKIMDNRKMVEVHATAKNSDERSTTRYGYRKQDGWVSVEITQRRKQHWLAAKIRGFLNKSQ